MPQFDLRGIKCAKYVNSSGTITYTNAQAVGDAMTAQLELRFAEGRLYAESTLAEYMRKAVGGTISLGVKYVKTAAQQLMLGSRAKTKSVTYVNSSGTTTTASVSSLALGGKDEGVYVGIGFYAPDMIDGVKKYTAVFIAKCLFGPPSMSLQTAGESIVFNTPTITGDCLASDATTQDIFEVATCDSEEEAVAWIAAMLT